MVFQTARKSARQTWSSRNMLEIFYTGAQGDGLTARARPGGQWFAPAERSRVNGVVTGVWSPPNAGRAATLPRCTFRNFVVPIGISIIMNEDGARENDSTGASLV